MSGSVSVGSGSHHHHDGGVDHFLRFSEHVSGGGAYAEAGMLAYAIAEVPTWELCYTRLHGSSLVLVVVVAAASCSGGDTGIEGTAGANPFIAARFMRIAWRRLVLACSLTHDDLIESAAAVAAWKVAESERPSSAAIVQESKGADLSSSSSSSSSSSPPIPLGKRPVEVLGPAVLRSRYAEAFLSLQSLLLRCGGQHFSLASTHDGAMVSSSPSLVRAEDVEDAATMLGAAGPFLGAGAAALLTLRRQRAQAEDAAAAAAAAKAIASGSEIGTATAAAAAAAEALSLSERSSAPLSRAMSAKAFIAGDGAALSKWRKGRARQRRRCVSLSLSLSLSLCFSLSLFLSLSLSLSPFLRPFLLLSTLTPPSSRRHDMGHATPRHATPRHATIRYHHLQLGEGRRVIGPRPCNWRRRRR